VAQGRRKGDPGVDFKKALCLQQKVEKGRVGEEKKLPKSPKLPKLAIENPSHSIGASSKPGIALG
jgi:hypothetical protein